MDAKVKQELGLEWFLRRIHTINHLYIESEITHEENEETLTTILEDYHQAKSKEEAQERYERAIKFIDEDMWTFQDIRMIKEGFKIASGINE